MTEIDTSDSWAAVVRACGCDVAALTGCTAQPEDSPTTAQYDPMIQAELQAQVSAGGGAVLY